MHNDNIEIQFEDIKDKIIKKLNEDIVNLWINEGISLIDWIFMQPIQRSLSSNLVIWWSSIPMVAVVWQKTWRVYFFAIKALLPDIY